MIYVLGDSFTWGLNFFLEKNKDRKQLVYPYHLEQKFNTKVKNLSIPGSSNWRLTRLLLDLPLTENDIVIIAWTESSRFEIPCRNSSILPNEILLHLEDLEDFESNKLYNNENFSMGSFIEKSDQYFTRRIHPALFGRLETIKNHKFRKLIESYYMDFFDDSWHDHMFSIMYTAALYKLRMSNCKFRMFNTFIAPTKKENSIFDIPEYIFGYKKTMLNFLRPNKSDNTEYYSISEHKNVAEILYKDLTEKV